MRSGRLGPTFASSRAPLPFMKSFWNLGDPAGGPDAPPPPAPRRTSRTRSFVRGIEPRLRPREDEQFKSHFWQPSRCLINFSGNTVQEIHSLRVGCLLLLSLRSPRNVVFAHSIAPDQTSIFQISVHIESQTKSKRLACNRPTGTLVHDKGLYQRVDVATGCCLPGLLLCLRV